MDIEEVTKWLKIMKANLNTFPEINCGKKIEALAEAIRLLKNEQSENLTGSTTKNDLGVDCISRADAISAVSKALSRIFVEYEDVANKIINKLPSVTPIRPKGHWIEHPHEAGQNWEYSRYECSECHVWAEDDSNYCPQCGADMRGEEE